MRFSGHGGFKGALFKLDEAVLSMGSDTASSWARGSSWTRPCCWWMPTRLLYGAQFRLNEAVLSVGAAYHAALAPEFLAREAAEGAREEF